MEDKWFHHHNSVEIKDIIVEPQQTMITLYILQMMNLPQIAKILSPMSIREDPKERVNSRVRKTLTRINNHQQELIYQKKVNIQLKNYQKKKMMSLMNCGTSLEIRKEYSINLEILQLKTLHRSLYIKNKKSQPFLEPTFSISDWQNIQSVVYLNYDNIKKIKRALRKQ